MFDIIYIGNEIKDAYNRVDPHQYSRAIISRVYCWSKGEILGDSTHWNVEENKVNLGKPDDRII